MFQFEHIFCMGFIAPLIHPTVLHASMQLMFYDHQLLSAGFKLFHDHTSELSNVKDTGLPTSTGTAVGFWLALYCNFRKSKFQTGATDQLLKAEQPGES